MNVVTSIKEAVAKKKSLLIVYQDGSNELHNILKEMGDRLNIFFCDVDTTPAGLIQAMTSAQRSNETLILMDTTNASHEVLVILRKIHTECPIIVTVAIQSHMELSK